MQVDHDLSSELQHKYNVHSILIRKDGEAQVDYDLSLELRHRYNICSIPIRKDDEVQAMGNRIIKSLFTPREDWQTRQIHPGRSHVQAEWRRK